MFVKVKTDGGMFKGEVRYFNLDYIISIDDCLDYYVLHVNTVKGVTDYFVNNSEMGPVWDAIGQRPDQDADEK